MLNIKQSKGEKLNTDTVFKEPIVKPFQKPLMFQEQSLKDLKVLVQSGFPRRKI
jgi:hypothetical protein